LAIKGVYVPLIEVFRSQKIINNFLLQFLKNSLVYLFLKMATYTLTVRIPGPGAMQHLAQQNFQLCFACYVEGEGFKVIASSTRKALRSSTLTYTNE
jgi:hypothetical protein